MPPLYTYNQFNYIFLFREDIVSNQRRLYEHYGHKFPTFDIFQKVFDALTDDYCCMVIDNTIKSDIFDDKIFWYKSN